MSALFTTIVIFTIGALCSTEGSVTTAGSNVVDIPGFSHGQGRCKAMLDCKVLLSGMILRGVCSVEDCHKLCLQKTCKTFEYYEIPTPYSGTENYCTVYLNVTEGQEGYCEGPLINDTSQTHHIVIFKRTGNASNPASFSTIEHKRCNRSVTPYESVNGILPRQCHCCFAQQWANDEVYKRRVDKENAEEQVFGYVKTQFGPVPRSRAAMSGTACQKSSYTEKTAFLEASEWFLYLIVAACEGVKCPKYS